VNPAVHGFEFQFFHSHEKDLSMRYQWIAIPLGGLAFGLHAAAVQGEVVASYQFTGASLASSDTATNSTAGNITVVNASNVNGQATYTGTTVTTNPNDSYMEFVVTPTPGPLTFTSFGSDIAVSGLSGNQSFSVTYSVNGISQGTFVIPFNGSFTGVTTPVTLPPTSSPVTFRIAVSDNGFSSAGATISFDNITAQAVPLPDAMAMFFSGVPCLIAAGWYAQRRRLPQKPA
jgi:hypothetical protein